MSLKPIRILIIEDESAHAEAILRALEDMDGVVLRVMGTLKEFREGAAKWKPDIALMDLNLPDGRATEVLADPLEARAFPIIVMTSFGSELTAVDSLKSGAFDYLVKSPESFQGLARTLDQLLREWQLRSDGKRMLRELQASEAKFRSLTESSTDFIMRYDPQGRHTYLNPAALRMLGLQAAEVLGKTHLECGFPEHLCHFWEAMIEQVVQTAQPLQTEFEFPGPRGLVTHDWRLTPELDPEGKVYSVLGVSRDVSEQKRSEEALQEAYQFNQQIIRSVQEGVIVYGLDLRYQVWNTYMEQLTGMPASEVVGKHPLEMEAFPREAGVLERLERALTGEAVGSIEFPYRVPKTGRSGWTVDHSAPFRNSKGEIIGVIGTVIDITERKQAEDALRASEEIFAKAFSTSPDGIGITRMEDGVFIAVNEGFSKITGYSQAEVVGHSDFAEPLRLWVDVKERDKVVAGLKEKCEVSGLEAAFRTKDGSVITGLVSAKIIDIKGVRHILAVTRNITERKQAEAVLRESEEKYRNLVETAQELVWKCDAQGRFTYLNPAWENSHGYKLEEMLGRGFGDFQRPEVFERDQGEFSRRLVEGSVKEYETTQLAKDGQELTLLFNAVPLINASGEVIGTQGTAIDITARRKVEAEKASLQAQLQQSQKMESLGLMAGGVAHDMNNVLGAILALATAHLELHSEASSAYRAFDTIVKASTRGGKMVKGLLALSRKGLAEEVAVDLNALVREEMHLLERTTLAKVWLDMDLAPDLPPVRGDAGALSHVLMNLCVNAVDAMEALPENGMLTIRTRRVGDEVEVEVGDNGSGMSEEVKARAFEPFFTTKAQGKGTGLGLSIVYSTIKAHQGALEIHSALGQGTRIVLRFPVAERREVGPGRRTEESQGTAAPQAHRALQVLLVDDDDMISTSVAELIGILGHATTLAFNGEEALAKLEAGLQPDVVILDLNMPGLGGAGTLPLLRAMRPNLPVLLATGRVEQAVLDLVQAHPGVSLMSKPFTMVELRNHLRACAPIEPA